MCSSDLVTDSKTLEKSSESVKENSESEKKFSSRGNGYRGYSMSNNAVEAYEDGEAPMSKWTKTAILRAVEEYDPTFYKELSVVPAAVLKDELLRISSWHHTSKMYHTTYFYKLNTDVIDNLTSDKINSWERTVTKKESPVQQKGTIHYLEWGGTRKHPKATNRMLTDVNIEIGRASCRERV